MSENTALTVKVVGGPTFSINYRPGMNGQQAIEAAFDSPDNKKTFDYALQFFGQQLGYLVVMINDTFESFISSKHPFYFWEVFVNGQPASTGIDNIVLNAGDELSFELKTYDPQTAAQSTTHAKYQSRLQATS